MHLAAVFRHAPQPCLLKAKLLFDHPERMLPFGSHVGLRHLDQIDQSSFRCVGQDATLAWPHGHTKLDLLPFHLGTLVDALIAGIRIDHGLLSMEQLCCRREVMHVRGCGLHRMDQSACRIHPDMDFHPVVPLIALLGLVHLWIPLALLVFRGGWGGNQGGINDRSLLHRHALGLEMGLHGVKNPLAQFVLLQQVAKRQDRRLIRDPLADPVGSTTAASDGSGTW